MASGMVWLGIDLGDARVGLALSDPELTFAHPAGNLNAWGDSFRVLDDVVDLIEDEAVTHVAVGLPLLLSGEEGKAAKKARRWADNLVKRITIRIGEDGASISSLPTIELVDERLTTVDAHRRLRESQGEERGHRAVVDQQAAVEILQTALDRARQREEVQGAVSGR